MCFVGLLLPKIVVIDWNRELWNQIWLGSAAALAILGSGLSAWSRQPTRDQVAMEVDKRFQLRERLSSALLWMNRNVPHLLEQHFSKTRSPKQIGSMFETNSRSAHLRACHGLYYLYCPALHCSGSRSTSKEKDLAAKQSNERITKVKAQTKTILDKIQKLKNEAAEKGLKEIADDYEKLEKKLDALQKSEKPNESKLLADLNDIKKEMQERKESLGSPESLKKAFEDMNSDKKGPADKFKQALQEADFDKAKKELEKLLEKLASKDLTEQEMKALAQQLKELQEAIDKAREDQKALLTV